MQMSAMIKVHLSMPNVRSGSNSMAVQFIFWFIQVIIIVFNHWNNYMVRNYGSLTVAVVQPLSHLRNLFLLD